MITMVSSPLSTNGDNSLWASSRNCRITSHPCDPDFGVRKGLLGVLKWFPAFPKKNEIALLVESCCAFTEALLS